MLWMHYTCRIGTLNIFSDPKNSIGLQCFSIFYPIGNSRAKSSFIIPALIDLLPGAAWQAAIVNKPWKYFSYRQNTTSSLLYTVAIFVCIVYSVSAQSFCSSCHATAIQNTAPPFSAGRLLFKYLGSNFQFMQIQTNWPGKLWQSFWTTDSSVFSNHPLPV